MLKAILWENGGTWSFTRKLVHFGTEAQLSAKTPFSGRMEGTWSVTRNFQSGTDTQLRAESHSLRMKDVSVGRAILRWFLDVFL